MGAVKLNIHMGGKMTIVNEEWCYLGGFVKEGMEIDPDVLSWFVFEGLMMKNKLSMSISQMWYKLPHQPLSERKLIKDDIDGGINKMCEVAMLYGEVDIYIENELSDVARNINPSDEENDDSVGEKMDEATNDEVEENDGDGAESLARRMEELAFEAEMGIRSSMLPIQPVEYVSDEGVDNDRQLPDTPLNTEDEWKEFERIDKEKRSPRSKYVPGDNTEHLYLGQTFHSGEEFKAALFSYVLHTQSNIRMSLWGAKRFGAICCEEGCPWRVYCSIEVPIQKWMIKVYKSDHNHEPHGHSQFVTMRHIAAMFSEEFRRNPSYPAAKIQYYLKKDWGLIVPLSKCFKARQIGLNMVMEDQQVQFAKLWDYENELLRSNPNNTVEIGTCPGPHEGEQYFDRMYVCFAALRETWKKSLRPVIGLDGCFLK
ncbi:PREDICTED: uncharacterized protein LOC104818597 isoform X2 [Tarenaya hassleriana]|uniref:uncharacterized protein LOC104818597 isoform X2 n=1 Tax=Tarenaya hassleriana TaxID=28532 RepID=UPI00053C0FF7|nr:PREDICTED: uncharacterized protein LOC104818597 isoform X2 [Tarenaya hassleriana]